jgi:glycosyltransferase involved in cell wall biosynthesis
VADYRGLGGIAVVPYSVLTYARRPADLARLAASLRRDVRTLRRELRRLRPDLVVVATTVLPAALVAARLEGVPAIVYAAEIYAQRWKRSALLRLWGVALARWTGSMAAGIVCCSREVAAQFPPRPGRLVSVAYPPVGPEYSDGDRARARAGLAIEDADPAVAVVGNIGPGRGQDVAIRAIARMRVAAPRARLVIEGRPHEGSTDVVYARELHELVERLDLGEAVRFTEGADVTEVYAAADVVVNPARLEEAFGRVLPEALMAGRAVVGTDVGAIHEVIRNGTDGVIVPPDDPDALASAVLALWHDPASAARMVGAGRERVRTRFGPEQDLAAWRGVVEAVVGRPC